MRDAHRRPGAPAIVAPAEPLGMTNIHIGSATRMSGVCAHAEFLDERDVVVVRSDADIAAAFSGDRETLRVLERRCRSAKGRVGDVLGETHEDAPPARFVNVFKTFGHRFWHFIFPEMSDGLPRPFREDRWTMTRLTFSPEILAMAAAHALVEKMREERGLTIGDEWLGDVVLGSSSQVVFNRLGCRVITRADNRHRLNPFDDAPAS